MAYDNKLGIWGEDLAVERLTALGYAIVSRRWRMGALEIDIIAKKDDTLVFAEVKTRADMEEDALDAVNKKKTANMIAAAKAYLSTQEVPYNVQFDLFGINGTPTDGYRMEHIPDAFHPPLKTY